MWLWSWRTMFCQVDTCTSLIAVDQQFLLSTTSDSFKCAASFFFLSKSVLLFLYQKLLQCSCWRSVGSTEKVINYCLNILLFDKRNRSYQQNYKVNLVILRVWIFCCRCFNAAWPNIQGRIFQAKYLPRITLVF